MNDQERDQEQDNETIIIRLGGNITNVSLLNCYMLIASNVDKLREILLQ